MSAEKKGTLLQNNPDISRLITGHAVNNSGDNKSALHAYEVALKTTHDKCQKQAEQLRQLSEDARRQLADKAELHAEIARLRESAGRQRERAGQLHRQLAASHRESSALRQQVALQQRQLSAARRRLREAGLEQAASLEQANKGTDEMDVQPPVALPEGEEGCGSDPDDGAESPDLAAMTEEEIARRLVQLQRAGHQSLQESFDEVMSGLQRVAAMDVSAAGPSPRSGQLSRALRRSNDILRRSVESLRRLQQTGTVSAPADGSLPPLQEIPLTGSPPRGRPTTQDEGTGVPSGRWPGAGGAGDDMPPTCPICGQVFRPPATRLELEDHVYAHVLDMTAEEQGMSAADLSPPASTARAAV